MLAFLFVGCGRGLVPVEGQVTQNGQPLADALVSFLPEESSEVAWGSRTAHGRTDPDGKFRVETGNRVGAFPGKYRVTVSKGVDPNNPAYANVGDQPAPDLMMKQSSRMPKSKEIMPPKFTSAKTTPFQVEVPKRGVRDVKLDVAGSSR